MRIDDVILKYITVNSKCRFEEQKNEMQRQKEKREIMGDNSASVSIDIRWQIESPDMSVCRVCREVIYGQQYAMCLYLGGEKIEQKRPVKMCEPCYTKAK